MNTVDKYERAVIDYMLNESSAENARVNILDADFVDSFHIKTGAKLIGMPFGAHKCPKLGKTLSNMYAKNMLDRSAIGLPGDSGMGFPKWVYSYRFNRQFIIDYATDETARKLD